MRIVIDENIPYGIEAFSTLGDVVALPGRSICRDDLADTDVLAVRSVTRVGPELLEGTPVKHVLTATIGTDHLDAAWLDTKGIRHASAPSCNADSVADYVTAALLSLAERQGAQLEGKTLGVVGCGNVGSRVADRGRALGMEVLENDPPLARETGDARYLPIAELYGVDYLTLHTPLTLTGPDTTNGLVDEMFLGCMRPEATLLNSGRGAVVSSAALKAALRGAWIADAALDVWENEPLIDTDLVRQVAVATPHIAGYSLDGKVNGTSQIYARLCEWLGCQPTWDATEALPEPDMAELRIDASGRNDEDVLREAVASIYPIGEDDARLRETMTFDDAERGPAFDRLRKEYPRRREFSRTKVVLQNGSEALIAKLRGISFQVNVE